jgi:DNA polymerase-3 subunit gamma/tau
MLSQAAFNAFLKTLEEPPTYAKFILATTEKHKILPTILSRCQIFDFNRISLDEIARHLQLVADKEGIQADHEALMLIAQKADGGMRDALSLFDLMSTFGAGKTIDYQSVIKNLHILDYDYYFRMVEGFMAEDITQVLLLLDEIFKKGFDGHNFIVGLGEHLRNLLVSKDASTTSLMEVSAGVQQRFVSQAGQLSVSFLLSALQIASETDRAYKESKNQRLHVELALLKMCHLNAAFRLQGVSFDDAEKKKS